MTEQQSPQDREAFAAYIRSFMGRAKPLPSRRDTYLAGIAYARSESAQEIKRLREALVDMVRRCKYAVTRSHEATASWVGGCVDEAISDAEAALADCPVGEEHDGENWLGRTWMKIREDYA